MDVSLTQAFVQWNLLRKQRQHKRRRRRITSLEDLASDIIFNILSRQSAKSLVRCRCLSKAFCSIIDNNPSLTSTQAVNEEPQFLLYSHEYRRSKTTLFLMQYNGNRKNLRASDYPIAEFANSHKIIPVSVCYGLFLFTNCTGKAFVYNPLKGQALMLPRRPSNIRPVSYGLGFDSINKAYKVVGVFKRGTQVYTLGSSSWRDVSSVHPYPLDQMPVTAYGDVHWMVMIDRQSQYAPTPAGGMIVTFDTKKEEYFSMIPHPDLCCKEYDIFRFFCLFEQRGCLGMADFSSTRVDIWVVKDYEMKEWVRERRVSFDMCRNAGLPHRNMRVRWGRGVIGAWEHGLLIMVGYGEFINHNLETGCISYIECDKARRDISNVRIYGFTGSLVSLGSYGNLMENVVGDWNYIDLRSAGF